MRLAMLLLLTACGDEAVENDRDGDRITDDDDPCLVTAAELDADLDRDGRTTDDACPFDADDGTDGDGDAVPDACDPFPELAGDTHRCTMPLLDKGLADAIFIPRGNAKPWRTGDGLRTEPSSFASILATVSLERATTTTIDVRVTFETETTASERYFKVWARANEMPARADLGCALGATGEQGWRVVLFGNGVEASNPGTIPVPREARLQITIETAGTASNVRCAITPTDGVRLVTATPDLLALPDGFIGFGVEEAGAAVTGIALYDRNDSPAFPAE